MILAGRVLTGALSDESGQRRTISSNVDVSTTLWSMSGRHSPCRALTDVSGIRTVLVARERRGAWHSLPPGSRTRQGAQVPKQARGKRAAGPRAAAPIAAPTTEPLRPSEMADAIRISDAARLLGVSSRTVHRMIAGGDLTPFYLPHSGGPAPR